jgi:hypothetical protein
VYIHRTDLSSWKSFATPFDFGLCCLTGVFLVTASLMLVFSYRSSREERRVGLTIQDALLVIYGALLQQGMQPKAFNLNSEATHLEGTENAAQ